MNQEQLPNPDLPSEGYVSLAEFNSLKNDIQDLAHEVRSLRLNNSTQSSARPPQNRTLNYRSNVICHFCHRPGHIQCQCREYLQLQNQTCNTCHPSVPPRAAPPNYQSLPYASMQPRSEDQYRQNNQSLSSRRETRPLNSQGSSQTESNRWPLQNYRQ